MPYVLGIDIGTTSTVAATARPDGEPAPQLLVLGTRGAAVPSVLYLDPAGQALVGEAAERRVVSHPERVIREVKRRVGDTVPVSVGDITVAPEDLYAAQARWVLDRAAEREGEPPVAVAVAVPATWGSYRTGIVSDALADAGLPDVTLVSEPRAAARHYLAQPRAADGATVAVYDFGGGTFDAAVLRRSGPDGCEMLGRPEGLERLGGADLDELVLAHVAAAVGDDLTGVSPQTPGALAALTRLRRECTEAKEALSADAETTVPVLLPGLQTQVRIVRAELEELITPAVEETLDALAAALDTAGVAPEDLEAILLVGGSSRIPLVAELLSARFGRPVAVDVDPQASVALGAARAAAESLAPATADAAVLAAAGAPRGWTVAAGTMATAFGDAAGGTTAETPDEAPARLAAAGSSFVPRHVPTRRRHVTGVRVLAVSAAVLGITVVTSMAGQTPAVIEAGRSTLSSVVAKLGDSVQPDAPAAAAAEAGGGRSGGGGAPMATDAGVFAGRRTQGHAIATVSPRQTGSTDAPTSSDPRTPAVVDAPGKGTTAPSPRPSGTTGGGAGTKAPSSPSPTSPGTATPGTGTPGTGSPGTPTTDPTTPPPTQEPTTPPPTQEPTTPPPTQEPTTPPPTQEPTTPPPATQEPTEPPTTTPTTPPATQEPTEPPTTDPTTPAATPTATATATETSGPTTDPVPPSSPAGGG